MISNLKYIILSLSLFISFFNFGQKKLNAYLQTKQYYTPGDGSFVEFQTQFSAASLKFKQSKEGPQAEVYFKLEIFQGNNLVKQTASKIVSPIAQDSIVDDFFDIFHVSLEPGEYTCKIELADLVANTETVKSSFKLQVDQPTNSAYLSDILIGESIMPSKTNNQFSKSGYDIIPRIATFYSFDISSLPTYIEVYNTEGRFKKLELAYFIEDTETKKSVPNTFKIKEIKNELVSPLILNIDISNVTTGVYNLVMHLRDDIGNLIDVKVYKFERQNDKQILLDAEKLILDPSFQNSITSDSLRYYLGSLLPICPAGQQRDLLQELRDKSKSEEYLRKLFQAFWLETAPTNTTEEWLKYKRQVVFVEEAFGTNHLRGFETDRGRVYLQYGAPSRTFEREISSSELPWEIWEYNKIKNFSNRKFLFYNPDLVDKHYLLLHSDMLGELKNPRWEYELNKRNTIGGNVDDASEYKVDSWGNNARQIMNR